MVDPRRPRALVIDDNAWVCATLCELLRTLGFEAAEARSGTEGLALFDQRPFDLVTTDFKMPGMNGWEIVDAVRSRAPATPIIMITGGPSDIDKDRARAKRVTVLPKPLRLDDLRRALESGPGRLFGTVGASRDTGRTHETPASDGSLESG